MPFQMMDILESALPGQLKFFDDRPNYDYVYRKQDLIQLKGREYHSKKNHLNYFLNNYQFEYVTLTSDMAEQAMQFIHEFNDRKKNLSEHEMTLLKLEEVAMSDVFDNLESAGYLSAAILINDKIEALCIGGQLNKKPLLSILKKPI